jgi:demethylmenaquinone methyltransferase / 2-methoxy-6-polyprenyl-1,4-benzoquinol methylase
MDTQETHFGFQQVPVHEKAQKVKAVFDSVAPNYDLMNDLMSLGVHRLWKHFTINAAAVQKGWKILDLAGGTGDLTSAFARKVGETGKVVLADINVEMLNVGRDRLVNEGLVENIQYVQADAEKLPFESDYFNLITIAFGLRNVTHKENALASMFRVLKPGGRLLILEFSQVNFPPLKTLYDIYSFQILPLLGKFIANDEGSYRYLAESIRMHPDQGTLKQMMEESGFERCEYFNLTGGIVALHCGYKF